MKKYNLILVLLLLISFVIISCGDDDNLDEPNYISSKIDEVNWDGVPEININHVNDTLTLLGSGNEQVIVFKIKFNGVGTYNLSGSQASYYTTIGGDVITSLYTLDENFSSQITVTNYNLEENIVKGNFELLLLKKWSNPENNVNSLGFTNGQFRGIIAD
ncbi:DUF6252 family protein [Gelidibacter salicanalis]|uniref:Uncharacterized protein n=1 Tax=Gelidibacter salicanalis TaxID=291193 RepID=A0A934KYN4_9FLAO|nr:DUF6252 family protein [Gelidibacter salicanalis]MBJ7882878.1 hypothetical protein [Gelidibacter salicanalis]